MAAADIDTKANVRLWILGDALDTSQDTLFDLIMPRVTGLFQDYTHRQLCQRVDFEERQHGRNEPWLVPYDAPITAVQTLQIIDPDGDVVLDDLTEGKDFIIAPSREYVQLRHAEERRSIPGRFRVRFPAGEKNIKIVYTSGFTDALMPPGIKMAFLQTVQKFFQERTASLGFESEKIGKYGYKKPTVTVGGSASGAQLPQEAKGALASWIKHRPRFLGRELDPETTFRRVS